MAAGREVWSEAVTDDSPSQITGPQRTGYQSSTLSISQTAHDLANFLTGIRMLVQSLSQVSPDERVVQQHIGSLQRAAWHASELCKQLQTSLAGQNDDLELDMRDIDIRAIIRSMRHLLEVMVRPGTKLEMRLAAGLPRVVANPTQIRQIVLDLVTNASDAVAGKKGGSITIQSGVGDYGEQQARGPLATGGTILGDRCVYLEVVDTGCGIPEKELTQIFEPTFTTKKDGHGLGLASVLRIMRGCGGGVTVASHVGQGTKVRCLFPLADQAPLERLRLVSNSNNKDAAEDTSLAITVLLVEDIPGLRHMTKSLLENSRRIKIEVLTAEDGREAMEVFRRQNSEISAVILDMMLPDCKGTELIRRMRDLSADIPVLIASAASEHELIAQCDGCHPNGILVKPFDVDTLVDKVVSILRT